MLDIKNIQTFYGKIQALRDVSIKVNSGEIVSLIGANGAGKSTLLMTVSGINKPKEGMIIFEGKNIEKYEPHTIVDLGIAQAPEGRRIRRQAARREAATARARGARSGAAA